MPHLSEVVGVRGVYETLQMLAGSSATSLDQTVLADRMHRLGVNDVEGSIDDFLASGILHRDGDRLRLSSQGIRTSVLLEAVNGGDLREAFRRLAQLDEDLRMYQLVREGMTRGFLRSLSDRPGFRRLYFCSPWINLDSKEQRMLVHAVVASERRHQLRPEILVITRPEGNGDSPPLTLGPFRDLDASIYLHPRLHTKLYIREPDAGGGFAMAIVGSQNLTKSKWLELGIRINNDGQMINQLIRYFLDIAARCSEA